MKPIYLRLKGFIGIYRATGEREVELDLSGLDADQRIVAFVGTNGSGKSTVLDNLQPYLVMPSRCDADGPVNPAAFSYYPNLNAMECERELVWEHDGKRYKTSQVWHINGSRTAEAYLFVENGDRWTPVRLPDGTLSDGKVASYTKCVEGILGSAMTFFTTQFAAQNRAQLSKYKTGDIKALLSDVLGHSHIEDLHARALTVNAALKSALSLAREEYEQASATLLQLTALSGSLAADEAKLAAASDAVARAREAVAQATVEALRAEEAVKAEADTIRARQRIEAERTAASARFDAKKKLVVEESAVIEKRLNEGKLRFDRDLARIDKDLAEVAKSIDTQERLLAKQKDVEQAKAELGEAEAHLELLRSSLQAAETVRNEQRTLEQQKREAEMALRQLGESLASTKEQQAALSRQAQLADEVPCVGSDLQPRCKLLTTAVTAKSESTAIVQVIDRRAMEYDNQRSTLAAVVTRLGAIGDAEKAVIDTLGLVKSAEARLMNIHKLTGLSPMIDAASAEKQAAEVRRAGLLKEREEVVKEQVRFAESAAHERQLAAVRHEAIKAETVAALAKFDAELANIPVGTASVARDRAQAALATCNGQLKTAEQTHAALVESIAKAKGQLAAAVVTPETAALQKARVEAIEAELGGWATLTKALSKDGILALSIDDAGPTLSSIANELLSACYGPRFTVSIETQVAKASGGVKEGFDILVDDQTSGTRASLSLMSGGEKVWLNECIARALALYLAQSGGARFSCLFTDESDGALDDDHKRMFMAMKRKILELGGYEREFFVSHTASMWDMADAVVRFPDALVPVKSTAATQGVLA